MRDVYDVLAALAKSRFRSRFRLGLSEREYLQCHGLPKVLGQGKDFIARRLAPADLPNDGKQTPWRGHPIFIAQHATACCCRSCLFKWHGIEPGHALTGLQQAYVLEVIAAWLQTQISREMVMQQDIWD
jgi:Domain of unknown function (DUF4186)